MRGSHVAVAFLLAVWTCSPSKNVRQPERVVYVPVYGFGLKEARPTNVVLKETLGEDLSLIDAMRIVSRYAKLPVTKLYPPKENKPQMLYMWSEKDGVWHAYPAPILEFCVDPDEPALARR